jgi:starch phosphorylase
VNDLSITNAVNTALAEEFQSDINDATTLQLHMAVGKVVMGDIKQRWDKSRTEHREGRMAFYLSAEYMTGRLVFNNLFNLYFNYMM